MDVISRRVPLRRVSLQRARENKIRSKVVRRMAERDGGQVCARCFSARAVDTHELLSRARGGSITDAKNLVQLCRPCHAWITTHPRLAELAGWALTKEHGHDDLLD